jgi:hypothetical protein
MSIIIDSAQENSNAFFSIAEGGNYPVTSTNGPATEIFRVKHDGTVQLYNDMLPTASGFDLGSPTYP